MAAAVARTQAMSSVFSSILRLNISMPPSKDPFWSSRKFYRRFRRGTKSRAAFFIMGRQKIFNTEEKRKQRI